jgi:transposase
MIVKNLWAILKNAWDREVCKGICGSAYRQNLWAKLIIKNPRWYEQHIYEIVCHMTNRLHTSDIWIFEVIFVDFRLMKNIVFNKTESFGRRNTSNHAFQIFCSKSNCMWNCVSLILPPRDNRGQNNEQSECFAPPTAIYTHGPGLRE